MGSSLTGLGIYLFFCFPNSIDWGYASVASRPEWVYCGDASFFRWGMGGRFFGSMESGVWGDVCIVVWVFCVVCRGGWVKGRRENVVAHGGGFICCILAGFSGFHRQT